MRYQGSKKKLSSVINDLVTSRIGNYETYVEPFCGGANSLSAIDFTNKVANDTNKYIIAFWNAVKNNEFTEQMWDFVKNLTKEQYYDVKRDYVNGTNFYCDSIKGYVAFSCSYGGGLWGGYANYNPNKNENHILEAYNGTVKQIKNFKYLENTKFYNLDYKEIMNHVSGKCLIYCDPPYGNTKDYKTNFDSEVFWEWCRTMAKQGHYVMVSEYNAPSDFSVIYQKELQDGMASTNKSKTEKIFVYNLA